jgi:hypothetical protein
VALETLRRYAQRRYGCPRLNCTPRLWLCFALLSALPLLRALLLLPVDDEVGQYGDDRLDVAGLEARERLSDEFGRFQFQPRRLERLWLVATQRLFNVA